MSCKRLQRLVSCVKSFCFFLHCQGRKFPEHCGRQHRAQLTQLGVVHPVCVVPVTILFGFVVCVIADVEGAHEKSVVGFGGCLANVKKAVVIIIGVSWIFLDIFNIIKI